MHVSEKRQYLFASPHDSTIQKTVIDAFIAVKNLNINVTVDTLYQVLPTSVCSSSNNCGTVVCEQYRAVTSKYSVSEVTLQLWEVFTFINKW
jgi:hypothetical protein